MIDPATVERIKNTADIYEVVSDYVLRQQAEEFLLLLLVQERGLAGELHHGEGGPLLS